MSVCKTFFVMALPNVRIFLWFRKERTKGSVMWRQNERASAIPFTSSCVVRITCTR